MFYKLLGYAVWNGGKLFLRKRSARAAVSKPVLAGVAVLIVGAAVLAVAVAKRSGSGS